MKDILHERQIQGGGTTNMVCMKNNTLSSKFSKVTRPREWKNKISKISEYAPCKYKTPGNNPNNKEDRKTTESIM